MAKYKAFISYRKSHAEYAELVKSSLIEKHVFSSNEIFLDKHDIGPEYFDTKLEKAVEESSSLILIVNKGCFQPKDEGEDWYLEEIQTALDNGITIIPILFDEIRSLDTKEIRVELKKTFDEEEIEKLIKTQSIRYDFDLSDATFSKLSSFIEKADKPDISTKFVRITKSILAVIAVLAVAFALFVGVGFLWGYFSSGTNYSDILTENTHIEGNTAIFEFGGLEAKYDLDQDSIFIDLENFNGEIPESNLEILVHSCSVSGAIILFRNNVGSLKYFKFLKGGSKPSKYAMAGVTVAACLGSFCGFSQGSKWGRTLHQQNQALALFPQLRNKDAWSPVFSGTLLNFKYLQLRGKRIQLPLLKNNNQTVHDNVNVLIWCVPDNNIHIASEAGLTDVNVVCKFNNWEIGKNTPNELANEIEQSRNLTKDVIILEVNSLHQEIKHFTLPSGMVGIRFSFPTQTSDISYAVEQYREWKNLNP